MLTKGEPCQGCGKDVHYTLEIGGFFFLVIIGGFIRLHNLVYKYDVIDHSAF